MLDYNVPGGKLNRGLSVVDTYALVLGRPLTEEEKKRAMVLGWCVEWVCGAACKTWRDALSCADGPSSTLPFPAPCTPPLHVCFAAAPSLLPCGG